MTKEASVTGHFWKEEKCNMPFLKRKQLTNYNSERKTENDDSEKEISEKGQIWKRTNQNICNSGQWENEKNAIMKRAHLNKYKSDDGKTEQVQFWQGTFWQRTILKMANLKNTILKRTWTVNQVQATKSGQPGPVNQVQSTRSSQSSWGGILGRFSYMPGCAR